MATTCQNCKSSLGCTCQVRTANDGTSCCNKCLINYNAQHPAIYPANARNTAPQRVIGVYLGPGKQV